MEFQGLADCHGLESFAPARKFNFYLQAFEPDDKITNMLALRATYNAQRHPVVYRVDIDVEDAQEIDKMMSEGKYPEALEFLKERANKVSLARISGLNAEKNWSRIPNPDLDPFH